MTLQEIVSAMGELAVRVDGDPTTTVSGLAYDSRRVVSGDLFACIPGLVTDGHVHAPQAVAAGATALLVERPLDLSVPQIVVSDARRALGLASARLLGNPASELLLLGVTGTNGKTTTTMLLESILRAGRYRTGLIGTIETRVGDDRRPGVRTTPESLDLHRLFAEMVAEGVKAVAMEVTSHALALHRVEGIHFEVASFTNLSQDHLDFHTGMEDYFAAKKELFTPQRSARATINIDDPYGRRLMDESGVPAISFGVAPDAAVRAEKIAAGTTRTDLVVAVEHTELPSSRIPISTGLVGLFNVSNCLAAVATGLACGIDPDAVAAGIENLRTVPGRFESVDAGQPFSVVVDYAHTPDSLDNVLREARRLAEHTGGRVVGLFGCGGDRDRGKRPLMGAVAARYADVVVVTSDNPRSEDPVAIIDAILEGVIAERPDGPDVVEPDRRVAIREALERARPGDVVVIAGKGHETGQEFADKTIPFDDRIVARAELATLGWDKKQT